MIFLDVRTPEEYAEDHVRGAVLHPVDVLIGGTLGPLAEVERATPICVYCRSGGRAGRAKAALEMYGFTNVQNLGGVEEAHRFAEGLA